MPVLTAAIPVLVELQLVADDAWAGLVAASGRRHTYEVSVIQGLNLVAFVLDRWPLAMNNSTCR